MRTSHSLNITQWIYLFIFNCFFTNDNILAQQWWNTPGIKISSTYIGNSTGHIADLSIENLTDGLVSIEIPPTKIPSTTSEPEIKRQAVQGFLVPEPNVVEIPPRTTVKVPLNGYCTDPEYEIPEAGSSTPSIDLWESDSPILDPIIKVINTIPKVQGDGHLVTPLSSNAERERESILQQFTWYYSHPKTYDPCLYIRRSLQQEDTGSGVRDTDWYSGYEQDIERGIAQIVDAMIKVGSKAGLDDFKTPILPTDVVRITPTEPSHHPEIGIEIIAIGTGHTTGHIADLTVHNPTNETIRVLISDGNGLFIPSIHDMQPYAVPSIPPIEVPPGLKVTVPVEGYCVDVRKPPVGVGVTMPPISDWISSNPEDRQTAPGSKTNSSPDTYEMAGKYVTIPVKTAPPLSKVKPILANIPRPSFLSNWDCPELPPGTGVLIPGTNTPIRTPLSYTDHPELAVPIILDAINRITQSTETLLADRRITTPFSNNPPKEREAVIQQTFWIFSADLEGVPYVKEDFQKKTEKQFESSTGRPISSLPQAQKAQLEMGIEDFWNSFQAVGAEAKILPMAPVRSITPVPEDKFKKGVNPKSFGNNSLSTTTYETDKPPRISIQQRIPPPEKETVKCDCDNTKIQFKLRLNDGTWKHFTGTNKNGSSVMSHKHAIMLKNNDDIKFETKEIKIECVTCNGSSCKATNISEPPSITSSDIVNGKIKSSPDSKNIEVKIIFTWTCEGGKNCDPSDQCSNQFTYIIPRAEACECKDYEVSGRLIITPADNSEQKTEDIILKNTGDNTSTTKVKKDDVIQIKMNEVVPKCKKCTSGDCEPTNIKIKVFPTNLTAYQTNQIKNGINVKNSKRGFDLLKSNVKIKDEIDTIIKLTIENDCYSPNCKSVTCNNDFVIKIPIEKRGLVKQHNRIHTQ